jgi:integrase
VLNDTFIRSAPPGVHWDKSLKGFGLRVGKNRKTFIVLVASGRRKSIAVWPHVSLADARKMARELLAHKVLKRSFPTHTAFDDAKAQFLAHCETRNRPRTVSDYRRLLKHLPFGRQSVTDITPRQILQRLAPLPPSEKHHAYTVAKIFFRHCVQHHLVERSPMENMASVPPGRPRTRVLTEDELRAVWKAARACTSPFHAIVALLVLTGQRRGEIARLEWSWIGDDTVTFPAAITKNGREHSIPIGPEVVACLRGAAKMGGSPYVFPASRQRSERTTTFNGWGKPKAEFDKECGVTGWTLHDLRRSYSTYHAKLGTPQIVVEKLLNHISSGVQSPISRVYNRFEYWDAQVQAVLTFERWLAFRSNSS